MILIKLKDCVVEVGEIRDIEEIKTEQGSVVKIQTLEGSITTDPMDPQAATTFISGLIQYSPSFTQTYSRKRI